MSPDQSLRAKCVALAIDFIARCPPAQVGRIDVTQVARAIEDFIRGVPSAASEGERSDG